MPHFVIDCSSDILKLQNPTEVLQAVHTVAVASNLFDEADIKVRLNPFKEHYFEGVSKNLLFTFLLILWRVELKVKKQIYQKK